MNKNGFISNLMDLDFNQFITIKMIKILYVISMIGSVLTGLTVILAGLAEGGVLGVVGGLLGGVITAALLLVMSRLWLELLIVIFRIADNTGKMANQEAVVEG